MLKSRLFLISFVPLWIIFSIKFFPGPNHQLSEYTLSAIFFLTATLAFLDAVNLANGAKHVNAQKIRIINVRDEGANAASYLVTYILPFVFTDQTDWKNSASLVIFIFILFVVHIRSNMGLINPTMYLLGWKTFQVDVEYSNGVTKPVVLLGKTIPQSGEIEVKKMVGGYKIA